MKPATANPVTSLTNQQVTTKENPAMSDTTTATPKYRRSRKATVKPAEIDPALLTDEQARADFEQMVQTGSTVPPVPSIIAPDHKPFTIPSEQLKVLAQSREAEANGGDGILGLFLDPAAYDLNMEQMVWPSSRAKRNRLTEVTAWIAGRWDPTVIRRNGKRGDTVYSRDLLIEPIALDLEAERGWPSKYAPDTNVVVFVAIPDHDKAYRPEGELSSRGGQAAALLIRPGTYFSNGRTGVDVKYNFVDPSAKAELLGISFFATLERAELMALQLKDAVWAANEARRTEAAEADAEERRTSADAYFDDGSQAIVKDPDDAPF